MKDYELYRKLEEMTPEERAELGIPAAEDSKTPPLEPMALSDAMRVFERSLDEPPEPRVPTHLSSLNRKLDGGFGPGELIYLAARAGVGKTSLALQFVTSAARAGFRTLVSSHEMLTMALCRRLVSQISDVSASQLKRKELNDLEVRRVIRACRELGDLPV